MTRSSKRRALLEADKELNEAGKRLAAARAEVARVAELLRNEEGQNADAGTT